jgi:hypothetical protein
MGQAVKGQLVSCLPNDCLRRHIDLNYFGIDEF